MMNGILNRFPVLILLCPYASGLVAGPAVLVFWVLLAVRLAGDQGPCVSGTVRYPSVAAARSFTAVLAAAAGMLAQPAPPPEPQEARLVRIAGTVADGPWPSRFIPGTALLTIVPGESCAISPRGGSVTVSTEGLLLRGVEPGARIAFPAELRVTERGVLLRTRSTLIRVCGQIEGDGHLRTIFALRRDLRARLDRTLDRKTASLCASVLLGIPGAAARWMKDLFRDTGTAHMLAISGLHVGIVLLGVTRLVRAAAIGAAGGGGTATALRIAALASLCLITGGRTPVLRASLVAALHIASTACGRAVRPAALLCNAALLILVADPCAAGEISFQMSFGGCAAILLFLSWWKRLAAGLPRMAMRLSQAAGISLAAWAGTAPLAAYHFGRVCWFAPVVNLAAIPVFGVFVTAAYAHLALAWACPPAAGLTAGAVELLAGPLLKVLETAVQWLPGPAVVTPPPAAPLCIYYAILVAALVLSPSARRQRGGKPGKTRNPIEKKELHPRTTPLYWLWKPSG
jgi:ComEC/Rec2-related protein